MFGGSFSEEQLYSAKGFLTALKDSHDCMREAARHRAEQELQKTAASRLLAAYKAGHVEFREGHVVKGKIAGGNSLATASIQAALSKAFAGFERAGDYETAKRELEKSVIEIGK